MDRLRSMVSTTQTDLYSEKEKCARLSADLSVSQSKVNVVCTR